MVDREKFIESRSNHTLDAMVRAAGPDASLAFRVLDERALGGNPGAQERVRRLDNDIHPVFAPDQGARLNSFLPARPKREPRIARFLPPDRDPFD